MAKIKTQETTSTSKESFSFDRFGIQQMKEYHGKPVGIDAKTLRSLARNYGIARTCINTLKHQISGIKWNIVPLDEDSLQNNKIKPETQSHIDLIEALIKRPNVNNETFRTLIDKLLEDILVLDAGYLEVVKNGYGDVVEMYHIDGATMKPVFDEHGMIVEYRQYLDGGKDEPDAIFEPEDIIVGIQNPRVDINNYGYGLSPIESVVNTVTNALTAELYNSKYFDNSTVPPLIINLKGAGQKAVEDFARNWQQMLQYNHFKTAIVSADSADINKIRDNNADMQFMEYQKWLAQICIASFEMSPQDIGFTMDINKATGEVQSQLSKSQGIRSIQRLIEELFNEQLIKARFEFDDVKFEWEEVDKIDEKSQADIHQIYLMNGVLLPNEVRQEIGRDPFTDEQKAEMQAEEDEKNEQMNQKDSLDKVKKSQKKKSENLDYILTQRVQNVYLKDNWI